MVSCDTGSFAAGVAAVGPSWFRLDPDASGYGLSPLSIAPAADSRWRVLFSEDELNAHLDRLQRDQQPDGGWPISWEPPSDSARLQWRVGVPLYALRTPGPR